MGKRNVFDSRIVPHTPHSDHTYKSHLPKKLRLLIKNSFPRITSLFGEECFRDQNGHGRLLTWKLFEPNLSRFLLISTVLIKAKSSRIEKEFV